MDRADLFCLAAALATGICAAIVFYGSYQHPGLVGYGCVVGMGPDETRTLYAYSEDDFPYCRVIQRR